MKCYGCGDDAVSVCRWCFVGLCRDHLAESLAERSPVMKCSHVMPAVPQAKRAGI